MRKMTFTILLTLGFGVAASVPALGQDTGKTIQLRNHFEAGKTIYLDLNTTSKGIITTQTANKPAQNPIESQLKVALAYKTLDVDQNQFANIEISYDQVLMFGESLGNVTQDLAETLGLKDRKTLIQVDSLGNVREKTEKTNNKADKNDPVQSLTRQMPYLKLPEQPVSIGLTWHESRQMPYSSAAKDIISHTTYTLEKLVEEDGQQIAVIQTSMRVHETDIPIDSSTQSGKNVNFVVKSVYKEFSIAGKGEIRFSISKGRILSVKDTQNVTINMLGNADVNKASFAQNVNQQVVQETIATFSETSPPAKSEPVKDEANKPDQK